MEQIVQKPPFPIKTKIAAWWMIISGILGFFSIQGAGSPIFEPPFGLGWARYIILLPPLLFEDFSSIPAISMFVYFLIIYFLIGAFLVFPIFLFKRKKWAWWVNVINLTLSSISLFFLFFYFSSFHKFWTKYTFYSLFHPLFLLILLLLDRKNFWKIAS